MSNKINPNTLGIPDFAELEVGDKGWFEMEHKWLTNVFYKVVDRKDDKVVVQFEQHPIDYVLGFKEEFIIEEKQ